MRPSLTRNESAARWPSPLAIVSPSHPVSSISLGSCHGKPPPLTDV
jgi:hypothetical protein